MIHSFLSNLTPFHIAILIEFIAIPLFTLRALEWTYWWQLKEYRKDRMMDFLQTQTGRHILLGKLQILELSTILLLGIGMTFSLNEIIRIGITLFSIATIGLILFQLSYRRLRPKFTTKGIIISATTTLIALSFGTILLYIGAQQSTRIESIELWIFALLIITFFIPLQITLFVALFHPITQHQRKKSIQAAKEKIEKYNPIVIGITGSYGKTSTKEHLRTLLSQKYSVLATPKNINVDIGVAQTILTQLQPSHDIFIVEMGAYKIGEIASICELASPIIGILTAINEQHLALFGSLENIKRAKAELFQSLPPSGLAIANADISACIDISETTQATKKFFSIQDNTHVYADHIALNPQKIQFQLHIGNTTSSAFVYLNGKQNLPSVLASVAVADHLGMSMAEITEGLTQLKQPEGNMHLKNGRHHYAVIDDSYNANPDGFMAALDYLALFEKKRKIVITSGMVELGDSSDLHHHSVGARAGNIADLLIITKNDYANPMEAAAKESGLTEKQIIIEPSPRKLIETTLASITADDVVLIEGRVQKRIRDYLLGRE